MAGVPYTYNYINALNSEVSPSTVHVKNTALSNYFRRYLLQKAISVFEWNLPETWARNYFLYVLYCWGYIGVLETDKFGVIPQHCGLQGYNVFYQPSKIIVANPLIRNTLTPSIGVNCTLIHLQPDYGSIIDIVAYYGDMLALAAESVGMNFVNSKLAYVYGADNKAMAESFKKAYDEIAAGNPAVVVDKALYQGDGSAKWNWFLQNVKNNYIASDVLSDMRKIEAMFDTDIGIPNANTDKRERLVTDEVNANNVETFSKASLWFETLQECCRKTNEMFGTNISVKWRFPNGGVDIGNSIDSGIV